MRKNYHIPAILYMIFPDITFFISTKMNTSQKILTTGAIILGLGVLAWSLTPFLQKQFLQEDDLIIVSEETQTLENSQKIPQKIKNTAEKVSGVFYINFQCPHCRSFYKSSLAPLHKNYPEKLEISIQNFPFSNTGLEMEMAKFFTCAKEQKEQFFVLDYFFFGMDTIEEMKTEEWIEGLKLNPEKFATCMETAEKKVLAEKQKGQETGVRGTPTFFLEKGEISEKFEGGTEKYKLEMALLPLLGE